MAKKTGKPTGRPALVLDPKVTETIVSLLQEGNFFETAANFAGVEPSAARKWIRRGAIDRRKGIDSPFAAFSLACARAKSASEIQDIRTFNSSGDWRATAWRRERLDPDRFGPPKEKHELSGEVGVRAYIGFKPEDV